MEKNMNVVEEPHWSERLRRDHHYNSMDWEDEVFGWGMKIGCEEVTPEQFGYSGGMATSYIQKAIDYLDGRNGGKVILAGGDYLSGTIVLKSDICLEIDRFSRLIASTDIADYPEHVAKRRTVMDTNMGMNQSLIYAEGCTNIAICGKGTIDGQGTIDNFKGEETVGATPGRPFLIRIIDCKEVNICDLTLTNPACWTQSYLNCEYLKLDGLIVRSLSNYNNDGIDIDGCRKVIVKYCDVRSGDDALCFKGASQRECSEVVVYGCKFYSSCNAIKIGTDTQGDFRDIYIYDCRIGGVSEEEKGIKHAGADSGISIESVDGGVVERIVLSNIKIERAFSPFFMRIDNRGRVKPGDPTPDIGRIRNIVIDNVTGTDNGPRGSYFIGIPERHIEDVVLKNIHIEQKASTKAVLSPDDIPLMYGEYPDAHMIDHIGDAPAYGLWTRDVDNLTLIDYNVVPGEGEKRPEYV